MLLIIHAGLHKTASTYLQAVLLQNQDALLAAGIYVQPEAELAANHSTAWAARIGDFTGIREHVRLARLTRRQRMILSSEDFESLIFSPAQARGLEDAARAGGVTDIEWHFCLRDPGEYFASQYSELCKHVFTDFAAMFEGVMREGRFDVTSELRRHPDQWSHCFDYETHMTAMAAGLTGSLVFHDYRDRLPFPAHAMIERLIGGSVTLGLPSDESVRNIRLPSDQVEALYEARLEKVAHSGELGEASRAFLRERSHIPQEVQTDCAAAISRRYAPGMERLLQMKAIRGGGA